MLWVSLLFWPPSDIFLATAREKMQPTTTRLTIRSSLALYTVFCAVAFVAGSVFAVFVLQFTWIGAVATSLVGVLLAATALGQGLFTTVELGDDWVRLRSPFKRVSIARQDVAAVNLWMATPFEESKPPVVPSGNAPDCSPYRSTNRSRYVACVPAEGDRRSLRPRVAPLQKMTPRPPLDARTDSLHEEIACAANWYHDAASDSMAKWNVGQSAGTAQPSRSLSQACRMPRGSDSGAFLERSLS